MKSIIKFSFISVLMAMVLSACTETVESKVTVNLDEKSLSLIVGDVVDLVAEVDPADKAGELVWSSSASDIVSVDAGKLTALAAGEAVIKASVGNVYDECVVTVTEEQVTVELDMEELSLMTGESHQLTVEVVPDDKLADVVWESSNPDVASVEDGNVVAIAAGEAVIKASVGDVYDECKVTVEPLPAAKIGDYLYDDGTWSDGGLVSIDPDGLNPVWADEKPAPLDGKTVVGIVFQTDPERIAESDKAEGYVNGYAVAVKFAHNEDKMTIYWSKDYNFSCLSGAKLASTWYSNVNGREETSTVVETYGSELATYMPAFDCVTNGFTLKAPDNSSGWFLPSTGQLWDMVANLCGHEAAALMKEWQAYDYDATWYCSENVSYDAMARFNETLSMIPEEDKDELVINDESHPFCSLWASTPYDSESANIINIGTDGLVELMCDWYDADCYARPILAF